MLQTIRDKITGWFAILFLGAIAVVFIFWGVEFGSMTTSNYAVKVNGERVPLETVRRAWQDRQSRLQQMLRGEIPEELKKSQQDALLNEYVRTQLLTERAKDLGFSVSDALMAQTISNIPELQVDGKFSRDRYAVLLRQQGRTEAQFEQELRANLGMSQLQNGITASTFVTPKEIERRQALEGEQREVDYALMPLSSVAATVAVSDADVQSWYEENKADYMTPETAEVQYIELTRAGVEKDVTVTEDGLKAYYEQVRERFETSERRRARHILITAEDSDDAAAQKQADDVLARLRAGGDFAALAKEYSKDPGSAANGGDLGWAMRGMFVGPFEDALFAMSAGELRGPVKTQFGYHILKLDEIEAGHVKSFDEARAELESEYRADRAQELFYEQTQKLADESFASLNELDSVARSLGAPLQSASGFTRQGGDSLGNDPQVIDAVFSEPVLERGQNSPLVTLGEDRALVLRVSEHRKPEQLPLDAVRPQIVALLTERATRDALAKQGAEALARLEAGTDWGALLAELKVAPAGSRYIGRQAGDVPQAVASAAFAAPRSAIGEKPVFRGVTTDDGSYALLAVRAVRSGLEVDTDAAGRAASARQAAQEKGSAEFGAYVAELERAADVDRNPATFE